MKKEYLNEIVWLRSIACLSIVMLHSIAWGKEYIAHLADLSVWTAYLLESFNMFLYYGTPMFIFITAFIFGYIYKDKKDLPNYFISKRVKFILIPYLCMGFFYAIPYILMSVQDFMLKSFLNIFIGDFHAYFVLIIFQFYLIFVISKKYLDRYSPRMVISISFVINLSYLAIFNFIDPINIPFGEYIWERFYWVPFPGWIFYFTISYYLGANYHQFVSLLQKYRVWVYIAPFFTGTVLLFLYYSDILTIHSSKRIDIMLHTMSIIFLVLYLAHKYQQLPRWVMLINQYSYGIYLIHTFYMAVLIIGLNLLPINNGVLSILLLFFGSVGCSMATIYFLNLFSLGKYMIGKVEINSEKVNRKQSYVYTTTT